MAHDAARSDIFGVRYALCVVANQRKRSAACFCAGAAPEGVALRSMRDDRGAALPAMTEEMRREFWATLALRHCRGLGVRSTARLLRHFGSALAAIGQSARWKEIGLGARAAVLATGSWRVTARAEWDAARRSGSSIILWTDAAYPALLREICAPPSLLYCRGDLSLLHGPVLAVVGSRRCSREGREQAAALAGDLAASGLTVASGMALGIDSAAHRAALPQVGRSIGVLGTGIDVVYPAGGSDLFAAMCRGGLLASEFAPGSPALPGNFPVRNRIISGMARAVLVVEAEERSGSLITARAALEQNREVYVLLGAGGSPLGAGCRQLVEEGAHPIRCARDIVRDLAPQLGGQPRPDPADMLCEPACGGAPDAAGPAGVHGALCVSAPGCPPVPSPLPPGAPPNAEIVLRYVAAHPGCLADAVCEATGITASGVSVAAVFLEMSGWLSRLPGGRFQCVREQR